MLNRGDVIGEVPYRRDKRRRRKQEVERAKLVIL